MKTALNTTAGLAVLAFVVAGCVSTPDPSPDLLAAESALQQAKSNPVTLEAGRAPLEKAEASLGEARAFYVRRRTDEYIHALRMGEGYVALAEARGAQTAANRKIASLNAERTEIVSQSRRQQVQTARAATTAAEARTDLAEARTDAALAELATYQQKQTPLGVTLILQDLQFATGSAQLTGGAQGRLAPLAAYLAKQPETRIQIAGHTDSQGSSVFNMDLSSRRAASVAAYLASTGVASNRISSVGMGEGSPVANNQTVAGRALNRRVEVTILN